MLPSSCDIAIVPIATVAVILDPRRQCLQLGDFLCVARHGYNYIKKRSRASVVFEADMYQPSETLRDILFATRVCSVSSYSYCWSGIVKYTPFITKYSLYTTRTTPQFRSQSASIVQIASDSPIKLLARNGRLKLFAFANAISCQRKSAW